MAEKPPATMPGWMKLLFLCFLGYVLYVGNFTAGTAPVVTPIATAVTSADVPVVPSSRNSPMTDQHVSELSNFLDASRWQRALNPEFVGSTSYTELAPGQGAAAGCGSSVTVRYRGTLSDGANFDPNHDERALVHFSLGRAPIAAMNDGLIGMQPGSVRQLKAAPSEVFDNAIPNLDSVLFRVEMVSHTPVSDSETQPFAMMQVRAPLSEALPQAGCGEEVHAERVWFDSSGRVAARDSTPWRLGDGSMPPGLDRAVHGMRLGEVRFAVLPPLWHTGEGVRSVVITRIAPENHAPATP